ncbi:nucleoside hydrolase [Corynebacterium pacaense]|uniref:nucleoside hydrolase n=1 Tax=Corynebacterium pacaense TaxID=1816684 RepID=UPI0009BC2BD8|nr:nucleoside hydrolase [Corynebacterium pacaense]
MSKKAILDLDTGIDDALALAYALGSPELEVIGITATYGNVLVETGAANDLALLDLFGAGDVPVYLGEPHASTRSGFEVLEISAFIHGENGIGGVELAPSGSEPRQGAVDFLIESVREHGDDLVIIATGPMTNLAAAAAKDPDFVDAARIVIMGGALTVPGNVSPWAEANINQDPDAANDLFRSGADVTMIGLDVTLQTLLTREHTAQWRELGTPAALALADMTDYYIKAYETTAPHLGGCGLHDPLAVGVAVDPSLVTLLPINLKVDVEGPTRGRTIGDEERLNDAHRTSRAAVAVDVDRFLTEFMRRIGNVARGAVTT